MIDIIQSLFTFINEENIYMNDISILVGLERSAKDLHRQTVSLERLRLIFIEEIDRSHKRIKSVFDEIRTR